MLHFISYHPWVLFAFVPIILIDATLKLISLWYSARNNQLAWFVCLGIFNTAGILPIIYLLFFNKKQNG